MRRLAARVHLWGGLLTAPLLLVLGLSGSALVFAPEIDDLLNGQPKLVSPPRVLPSLDAVVTAALVVEPGAAARALRLPARPEQPFVVELAVGGHRLDAAVDGSTLRVVDVPVGLALPVLSITGCLMSIRRRSRGAGDLITPPAAALPRPRSSAAG